MKTVVVTGSARGFGFEMLKFFRKNNFNVVLCDVSKDNLKEAEKALLDVKAEGKILSFQADVTSETDIQNLIDGTLKQLKTIDIWINNAGVNQPNKPIWELDKETINRLIDIDIKGTVLCTKLIMPVMIKQNGGQIFNVEGYGSNDAIMLGLSL